MSDPPVPPSPKQTLDNLNIDQLDGNASLNSSVLSDVNNYILPEKIRAAIHLPKIASYNLRSIIPKIGHLKMDLLERKIQCAFLTEIWQQTDNTNHQFEIEKMFEMSGLAYISCPRPPNAKGISYGGGGMVWYGFTAWTLGLFACL